MTSANRLEALCGGDTGPSKGGGKKSSLSSAATGAVLLLPLGLVGVVCLAKRRRG